VFSGLTFPVSDNGNVTSVARAERFVGNQAQVSYRESLGALGELLQEVEIHLYRQRLGTKTRALPELYARSRAAKR
jgi:hypothetical protein